MITFANSALALADIAAYQAVCSFLSQRHFHRKRSLLSLQILFGDDGGGRFELPPDCPLNKIGTQGDRETGGVQLSSFSLCFRAVGV